jgi:hypothetical protein
MKTRIGFQVTLRFGMRALCWCLLCAGSAGASAATPQIFEWERGFGLRLPGEPAADMFLWVYEWNMFEAMAPGQHTHGTYNLERHLNNDATEAQVVSPQLHLTVRAVADGAELVLRITNRTTHAWPAIAGIIPCWNPGQVPGTNPSMPLPLNRNFADPWKSKTFFVSSGGLTPLSSRAMHFNTRFRSAVEAASDEGKLLFSNKWPTSDDDATAGLIVRESEDGRWVTGIAWEDFLSVQAHNPWSCVHVCVRVGALQPGESRTIRGRLYLFAGDKEECAVRFRRDFPSELR